MEKPKRVIFIRHGENEKDWSLGDAVPLNDRGIKQVTHSAHTAAEEIVDLGNVAIIHSGIERAKQTAEVFAGVIAPKSSNIVLVKAEVLNSEYDEEAMHFCETIFSKAIEKITKQNVDTIIIVTHAHNAIATIVQSHIDFGDVSSRMAIYGHYELEKIYSDNDSETVRHQAVKEVLPLLPDCRQGPLKHVYGEVTAYDIPVKQWQDFQQGTGSFKTSFCPYL